MHADAGSRRRRRLLMLHTEETDLSPGEAGNDRDDSPGGPTVLSGDADYLACCGAVDRAVLCVENSSGRLLQEVRLDRPFLKIGSAPDNDVCLQHAKVQPYHLVIGWLPGGLFFQSLSTEVELRGPQGNAASGWWVPGMALRTRGFRFRIKGVRNHPPEHDPLAVSSMLEAELPRLEWKFLGTAGTQRPWRVTRPLTLIGRLPVCKICLNDPSVEPLQAALVRTSGRLWIHHLGVDGCLKVNDESIASVPLDVGDRLQCGNFQLELQAVDEWLTQEPYQSPAASQSPDLQQLLRDFAERHRRFLETQLRALRELEILAQRPGDRTELQALIARLQAACQQIDRAASL